MRAHGISYDTGFVRDGRNSRPSFDPGVVRRELRIIRDDLHCDAVRVIGGDPERLELAAGLAAGLGLEVWFSPYPLELDAEAMLDLFADCAERAERIRRGGAEVVFVTGAELCLMSRGILPGDSIEDRVALLARPDLVREQLGRAATAVNAFLSRAVATVRARFGGRVTYASVPFERVDWTPFDLVSVDVYRDARTAGGFAAAVPELVAREDGKPVAVTEFGSATYRGAGDRGALGLEVVVYDAAHAPERLATVLDRDEEGQARYLRELLTAFHEGGVDTTFVFTFALADHVHRPGADPREDLDLASFGIVKSLETGSGTAYPGLPWEPKAAFGAVADFHRGH
ncbi:hypothetical protein ACFCX4_13345 [Kitasatospora sp. NPDC056327]|uniref:hypothetical protein n=1 Tax=Kitasatospora sp. NPDC056327 TaxID=3345785 RepID=UPI0035DA05E8